LSAVFDWLIKTHISLRLRDGSSLGALWEQLSGSSLGALWELVAVAGIELHEKLANEVTELYSVDPRNHLFNRQEEGDYLFGQGIINEASSYDKE
jgi:hypothetical protein